jgi:signal transduction histidine kinase
MALLNATVVLSLILYDNHTFHRVAETANTINQINVMLDMRGRERYKVQKHFTDWLADETPKDQLLHDFSNQSLFARNYPELPLALSLDDWPNLQALGKKVNALEQLKLDYVKIFSNEKDKALILLEIHQWTSEVSKLIDEIQNHNVQLSNYLSEQIVHSLENTVIINAVSLMSIFLLTYFTLFINHKNYQLKSQKINQELHKRQNESSESKKTLLSLMEDLRQENNDANRLSGQLQLANSKMQRKNEEMEQFVYTVSHDLKSPLVTISGFAKKLDDELHTSLTKKQRHKLQRILDNVTHMEQLLIDLLQLSRVIRQEIGKSVVDIDIILNQQIKVLETSINKTGTKISVKKPLCKIFANERLVSQCILNLLTNSIKYRDTSRPLVINISTEENAEYASLLINDNGTGIDPKYHQRIFKIFERLEQGEGTGVGLTIVKTVMDKHEGRVELVSELGIGSQFKLLFPVSSTTEMAAEISESIPEKEETYS